MDQDDVQDQQQFSGDDLAELHDVARQLQMAGDPRATRVANFIAAQSGGGDGSGGPGFAIQEAEPVPSWQEDLENDLWGEQAAAEESGGTSDAGVEGENDSAAQTVPAAESEPGNAEPQTAQPKQERTPKPSQVGAPGQQEGGQQSPAQPGAGTEGHGVYIVGYTVGNHKGDEHFKKMAYTRANDIQNAGSFDPQRDTVLVYAIKTKDNFKWALQDAGQFGKIQQLALFGHGGKDDGPIFHTPSGAEEYLSKDGAADLKIDFAPSAQADLMVCHTATNGFAQKFANAHGVVTRGFGDDALSGEPDRKTYGYMYGDREYMVGSKGFWHRVFGEKVTGPQVFYPTVTPSDSAR